MPARFHSGIRGIPWAYCDVCGRPFPLDQLQMQNGSLKDSECFDNPFMYTRDQQIAEFLATAGPEAENLVAKVRQNPNDQRKLNGG